MGNVWIFQANTEKKYNLFAELEDPELNEAAWTVTKHKNDIKKGDIALMWVSGDNRGIYAIVDIISDPQLMDVDRESWISYDKSGTQELMVQYRYRSKFKQPFFESEIKKIPGLSELSIVHQHQGTNFPVTKTEWDIILKEINKRGLEESPEIEYDDLVQSDSWETISDTVAVKKMDRSSFIHHGTGIPIKIRGFFNLDSITPGRITTVKLLFGNEVYEAKIRVDKQPNPRTQVLWHADLESKIKSILPKWYQHFLNYGEDVPESPEMRFIKLDSPMQYAIQFIEPEKIISDISSDIDESEEEKIAKEGRVVYYYGKRYERDPENRRSAIEYHGFQCSVCGFDFFKAYGDRGHGFIEIHHIKPISTFEQEIKVNPKTDLVPVCANCHRMIHRKSDNILSIEEMKKITN